jgi:hypothetical protein
MVRSRRESHHSDGITDQKSLQRTSATKSTQSGHRDDADGCPLLGVKRTLLFQRGMSAVDPKRTIGFSRLASDRTGLTWAAIAQPEM